MTDSHWSLRLSGEARRGLHRLPDRVAPAIVEFITGPLTDNPLRLSKPLSNELLGLRSARRGDYRVFLEVDEPERSILVVRINHRADVYRPRP